MKQKELERAIEKMVHEVNWYSFSAERAKKRNLPMIEQDYFSRILGVDKAMLFLGYLLEADGKRTDYVDGEVIEYTIYKAGMV